MIETSVARVAIAEASPPNGIAYSAATDASIAAYFQAAQRMHTLTGIFGLAGIGLIVLLLVTWAMGILPGAVRLF